MLWQACSPQQLSSTKRSRPPGQRLVHRQPARHRFFAGFAERPLQQLHLLAAQRLLETLAFFAQFQQALTFVGLGRDAFD